MQLEAMTAFLCKFMTKVEFGLVNLKKMLFVSFISILPLSLFHNKPRKSQDCNDKPLAQGKKGKIMGDREKEVCLNSCVSF